MGGKRLGADKRMGGRTVGKDPSASVGLDWQGAWKSWVAKDAIKPVNMTGCRPPPHAYNVATDQPTSTTVIGGRNAPFKVKSTYQRFDPRGAPSDRTKEHARTFENAQSHVQHDPLAAYHPPTGTTLPQRRHEQEPDRWVPMNHPQLYSQYNPLTHKRTDISKIKIDGAEPQDNIRVELRRGDSRRAPGNNVPATEILQHDPHAFHRKKGVTDFAEITHPFKSNSSDQHRIRLENDHTIFRRRQGAMVTWMHAAIIGKSKIPFRATQPPGV
mmetsp:Transcript_44603/g.104781  ORF Transcript_44603/g.104781 Transcript_44603/m.104781 type:complete len:271 (-) Transcript_44603:51-863(-)